MFFTGTALIQSRPQLIQHLEGATDDIVRFLFKQEHRIGPTLYVRCFLICVHLWLLHISFAATANRRRRSSRLLAS